MTKLNEIKKYLNQNEGKEKQELIKDICKKFSITEKSAEIYYYQWKREFTGSNNCKPKEEKKTVVKPQVEEKKEEVIIKHDVKPINADEQEVFKKPQLKIITAKVKGEYGEYEITEQGIKVGEDFFKNEEDLEQYRKEQMRKFYLMLGEITEVFKMVK